MSTDDAAFMVRAKSLAAKLLAESYEKRGWNGPAEEVRSGQVNAWREAAIDAIINAMGSNVAALEQEAPHDNYVEQIAYQLKYNAEHGYTTTTSLSPQQALLIAEALKV